MPAVKRMAQAILVVGWTCMAAGTTHAADVELAIDSARFEAASSRLVLNMSARNGSADTVRMLRPDAALFDRHYALNAPGYVGVKGKPWSLKVERSGRCSRDDALGRVQRAPSRKILVTRRNEIAVAPGARQELGPVELEVLDVAFCPEAKYSFQVGYAPAFALPGKEAGTRIDALLAKREIDENALRELLPDDAKFIADAGFLPENAKLFSGANEEQPSIERYMESVRRMEAIAPLSLQTNSVQGNRPAPAPKAPGSAVKGKGGKK